MALLVIFEGAGGHFGAWVARMFRVTRWLGGQGDQVTRMTRWLG